jgi:hypothetical protein
MTWDRDERRHPDPDRFAARRNPDDSCKRSSMWPAEPPRRRSAPAMLTPPCEEKTLPTPSRSSGELLSDAQGPRRALTAMLVGKVLFTPEVRGSRRGAIW